MTTVQTSPPTKSRPTPTREASAGTPTTPGAMEMATPIIATRLGCTTSPPTMTAPTSMQQASAGTPTTPGAMEIATPINSPRLGCTTSPPTSPNPTPKERASAGTPTTPDAIAVTAPTALPRLGCTTSPSTTGGPTPIRRTSAGTPTTPDARVVTTPKSAARLGSTTSPPASEGTTPRDAPSAGTPTTPGAIILPTPIQASRLGCTTSPPASTAATPMRVTPAGTPTTTPEPVDPLLVLAAETVDDLERTRIAAENRVRSMRQVYGLGDLAPQVAEAQALTDGLAKLEHDAVRALQRALRRHPLGPWVKRTAGVGEKQGARLLAAIGDPYWNDLHERPRTVSELQSYCGVGDAREQVRRRGHKGNWNATARMRLWNVAQSCLKAKRTSPYGPVYDEGRTRYADAVHDEPCARCGPSGKPALAGSPLSLAHQHARAIRLVMKAVLRDLFAEACALHEAN